MMRVSLQPSFVLHTRPYRNTSLLVELFTQQYGRVSAIARSARGPKSRYKGCLQPFVPLLVSWSGREELMQLGAVELQSMPYLLNGKALLSGFYLNELLIRLVGLYEECSTLFIDYQKALESLSQNKDLQISLRLFEKQLLASLGYGLILDKDSQGKPIRTECWYQWLPNSGLSLLELYSSQKLAPIFCGRSLLALHQERWENGELLQDAKHFMRLIIKHYLGSKVLKSRELMS